MYIYIYMFVSNIRENGQFTFSSQLLASHMSVLCISSNHGVSSHITIFVYIYIYMNVFSYTGCLWRCIWINPHLTELRRLGSSWLSI